MASRAVVRVTHGHEGIDVYSHAVGGDTEEHDGVVALEVGQVATKARCDF